MAGAVFELQWDDTALREAARRLITFSEERSAAMWNAIGHYQVSATQLRFDEQHDPRGVGWKPSQRALKEGGQTLIDEGFLLASLTYNLLGYEGVEVGSNRPYAPAMQFGADFTVYDRGQQIYRKTNKAGELQPGFVKKSKSNFANWIVIPEHKVHIGARPYLGLSKDDGAEISAIAIRHEQAAMLGERP